MIGYGVDPDDDSRYFFYTIAGFARAVKDRKVHRCNRCMVILDEAHNIRGGGAQTMAVVNYAKRASKVLLLTATPVMNNPYDISALINIVDGDNLLNKRNFKKILKDPDEFYDYFSGKISIFSPDESEIKKYYPKSENHDIFITMPKEYEKKYNEVESREMNSFIVQLFGITNLEVFYNGVRRGSNNLEENSPKIRWIVDKIKQSRDKDKFVIFSHFLNAGSRLLMRQLDKKNIPYAYIDGTVSKLEREEIVEKYNNNEIKALLISKAGGEGLDLKETRNVIIIEPSWNEATHQQIIGRAVRYKSHENLPERERKVDIYRLYLIRPSEEKILNLLTTDEIIQSKNYESVLENEDSMLSVDLYLKNFVIDKKNKIDEFLEMVEEVCIENDSNF
jgi:SNF2 family DNA or RNA helicase